MKAPAMLIGIVLIALGLVAVVYQGITYTTREKVVDLGPLKITAQKEKTIPLPPILGGSRWRAESSWSSWPRASRRADRRCPRTAEVHVPLLLPECLRTRRREPGLRCSTR